MIRSLIAVVMMFVFAGCGADDGTVITEGRDCPTGTYRLFTNSGYVCLLPEDSGSSDGSPLDGDGRDGPGIGDADADPCFGVHCPAGFVCTPAGGEAWCRQGTGAAGSGGSPAGGSAGNASSAGSGGANACAPAVVVDYFDHGTQQACPGDKGVKTLFVRLQTLCINQPIKRIGFSLMARGEYEPTDSAPYCSGSCYSNEDWYFSNGKLMDQKTGQTYAGPLFFKQQTANTLAYLDFQDEFLLEVGKPIDAVITFDVAPSFASMQYDVAYTVYFNGLDHGNGDIPIIVNNKLDPSKAVTVSPSCAPLPSITEREKRNLFLSASFNFMTRSWSGMRSRSKLLRNCSLGKENSHHDP